MRSSATEPQCKLDASDATVKFVVLELRCNVSYSGDWRPLFNCLPRYRRLLDENEVIVSANDQRLLTTIFYRRVNLTRQFDNASFNCSLDLLRADGSIIVRKQSIFPFYWKSDTINITCK